jgi:hypothetical protein
MKKDEVVSLYRHLLDQQPWEALDKTVLETYRRVIRPSPPRVAFLKQWWRRIGTRAHRPIAVGWQVPLSLAVGLLLGIVLTPLMPWYPGEQVGVRILAPPTKSVQETYRGLPPED